MSRYESASEQEKRKQIENVAKSVLFFLTCFVLLLTVHESDCISYMVNEKLKETIEIEKRQKKLT